MTNSLYENRTKAISGVIGAVAGYWLVSQSRKNKYKTWKKIAGGILGTTLGVEIAKNMINKQKEEEKKSKVFPIIAKYKLQSGTVSLSAFNTHSEFWDFMSGITEGIDKITTTFISGLFGNEKSKIRLDKLSSDMIAVFEKVSKEKIIGGIKFVAKNGSTFALIAYAGGNVEIGLIIDGVTVAADCTLAFIECQRTGDYSKFVKKTLYSLVLAKIGGKLSEKIVKNYLKGFEKIPDDTVKKAIDSISNIIAEYAGSIAGRVDL